MQYNISDTVLLVLVNLTSPIKIKKINLFSISAQSLQMAGSKQ